MKKMWLLPLMITPMLFAQDNSHRCRDVGGSILTNFVDQSDTMGSATGDLKGGLGVHVISVTPGPGGTTVLHNQHHWVTEQGDTLLFNNADATLYPTPVAGLFAASYLNGVKLIGGTGRFEGATGNLTSTVGTIDIPKGQIVLRYEGTVCFEKEQ